MKRGFVVGVALLAVMATGGARAESGGTALPGRTYAWTYVADTLGLAPSGSRVVGGRWAVVEDSTQAGVRLLRQLEDDDGLASHALQFLKPRLADQEVSVRFRIRSGEIDPSAGVVFHLDAKGKNGYLVRVSAKDRELIVHYLLNGRRRDLKMADIPAPKENEWHTLTVRRMGERIEAAYDGVVKVKLRDERFHEGNVGLWTEDDTIADFTDLSVRSL